MKPHSARWSLISGRHRAAYATLAALAMVAMFQWLDMIAALAGSPSGPTTRGYQHDDSPYCQDINGQRVQGKPPPGTHKQIPCNLPPAPGARRQTRSVQVTLAAVGWISFDFSPVNDPAMRLWAPGQAAPIHFEPQWVPLTYMALQATRNPPPPTRIADFAAFRQTKNFRAILYCKLRLTLDARTNEPISAQIIDQFADPGYTPPFNRNEFPPTYLGFWDEVLNDQTSYPGDLSKLSGIYAGRHPNAVLAIPASDRLLIDGMIKFRAGKHTDDVGLAKAGTPYHVPWVWSEFALTYANGKFYMYGAASMFPTIWWYWNGSVVYQQHEAADSFFPIKAAVLIDAEKMQLYPILTAGAPASGPQSADQSNPGAVRSHPFTVSTHGRWRREVSLPK